MKTAKVKFFKNMGPEAELDLTDGLRVHFDSGDVIHLRPSGNAPEFRIYAESSDERRAGYLVRVYSDFVSGMM